MNSNFKSNILKCRINFVGVVFLLKTTPQN